MERIREERAKRAEVEQVRRRDNKLVKSQQRAKHPQAAPLYTVLVEAGGELAPEELYKRSEEQRKEQPEQERHEAFYVELDTEVTAELIVEERPALDKVLLHAIEHSGDMLDNRVGAELASAQRCTRAEASSAPTQITDARLGAREVTPLPDFPLQHTEPDSPKGKRRKAREEVHRPSLWDELP